MISFDRLAIVLCEYPQNHLKTSLNWKNGFYTISIFSAIEIVMPISTVAN